MSPKRGQPPKPPEDRRENTVSVYLSSSEKEAVETARDKESPDRRIGAYIRDLAIDHAEKVNRKKK